MSILVLSEAELRRCVAIDSEAVAAVGRAFSALHRGDCVMPPILRLDVDDFNGEVDVKSAYVKGFEAFAVKLSSGFFDNPKRGLSTSGGMMALLDSETGHVRAVLLDNGYLTEVRTAAAGAVAAKHLAPESLATVGVIGAGIQARLQIEALGLVREFGTVLVWARDAAKAGAYAEEMSERLGLSVAVADSVEQAVRESDLVVTATPSRTPLVRAEWLSPGQHLTAIGSDAETKNELDPAVLAGCDLYACDSRVQVARLGELHHAIAAGAVADDFAAVELGAIVGDARPGRTSPAQITVCDLTGTGVQDTAIATVAYHKAKAAGLGAVIGE